MMTIMAIRYFVVITSDNRNDRPARQMSFGNRKSAYDTSSERIDAGEGQSSAGEPVERVGRMRLQRG